MRSQLPILRKPGTPAKILAMGGRVLLIEDEANIAEAIRFLLTRDGWEVSVHAEGSQAAEKIASFAPDLLILDLMLLGRSGLDTLAELRAAPATAALPVIMLTAKGQGADRAAAENAGFLVGRRRHQKFDGLSRDLFVCGLGAFDCAGLCCTNRVTSGPPLSPDGLILRLQ